ncbi:LytTR family DNA-binding domain-containing protein [Ruegeria sp.]|uniref:LytTR family DNA-binding domain-containing protein n=1 Tax=Ruegeria sp. TaxID=1879320 RepID=UPI003B5CB61C
MGLALGVTWIARQVTQKWFADTRFSWRDVALVLVILALFAPALWLMSCLLFTVGGQQTPNFLSVAPYGALFATGLVLVRGHSPENEPAEEPALLQPRLIKRLPQGFHGTVYRLTVQDHFVNVVTSEGTFTIRSRFTDAIAEMEPVPGHCTHRSHWVTDAAIDGIEKADGKLRLRLKNGDLVPVSRKYKPMLEEDGIV